MRKAEKTITVLKKHALTKMLSDVSSSSKNVCRNDHDDGKLYTLICQLIKKENTPLKGTFSVIIQIFDLLVFFFAIREIKRKGKKSLFECLKRC